MKKLVALIYKHDDLGHLTEATIMLLLFAPLSYFSHWTVPAIFVTGYFYGREKAQWELAEKARLGLKSVIPLAHKGLAPWTWSRDQQLDLYVPVIYGVAMSALAGYLVE
jgi:hypothetical protein